MSIEELRKKRAQLKANSDITFNNMQVIADESLRVAEVTHNSREILENLDAEFERQTGLDKTDTSEIQSGVIDKENGELVIITSNTKYYCPLEYCQWEKQDKFADLVPEYEWIKRNYKGKLKVPEIEENKVLLVLSDFDKYYYHGTYCTLSSKKKVVHFCGCPHVGTFQDSFIISSADSSAINIRYFPHYQNIKFYSEITDGMPLFVENIGDVILYVDANIGLIRLEPGERKEVRLENIEQERPVLPSGDLYPAEIIE